MGVGIQDLVSLYISVSEMWDRVSARYSFVLSIFPSATEYRMRKEITAQCRGTRRARQSMPSDAAAAALRDMEHHINLATQFIQGLVYEAFRDDTRTVHAVTRCLEII
jgi:hypothetical protein